MGLSGNFAPLKRYIFHPKKKATLIQVKTRGRPSLKKRFDTLEFKIDLFNLKNSSASKCFLNLIIFLAPLNPLSKYQVHSCQLFKNKIRNTPPPPRAKTKPKRISRKI